MDTKTFDKRYRRKYLCFLLDEPIEEAREKFFRKYRQQPVEEFTDMGLFWLGSVPDPLQPTQLDSSQLTCSSLAAKSEVQLTLPI